MVKELCRKPVEQIRLQWHPALRQYNWFSHCNLLIQLGEGLVWDHRIFDTCGRSDTGAALLRKVSCGSIPGILVGQYTSRGARYSDTLYKQSM